MKKTYQEIEPYVNGLMQNYREKNRVLSQQLKDLGSADSNFDPAISFPPVLKYCIGVNRLEKSISTKCNFEDFFNTLTDRRRLGDYIGYESNFSNILLRNDRDLQCALRIFFNGKETAFKFLIYTGEKINDILRIKGLNPSAGIECTDLSSIHFRFYPTGQKGTVTFTSIPKGIDFYNGYQYIKSISSISCQRIFFVDGDGDNVEVASDVEWQYMLQEGQILSNKGIFGSILAVQ